ncbi:LacI family DNA-binding transcriptional regulator [Tunturiibacter gelidoferens]|uniref:LacI family DNA-binding transcriptional regulator n=1 Tax=Tunturiibacter gelidiferens TaxID=3069689 RepID=A0AAU7YXT5_9BACT
MLTQNHYTKRITLADVARVSGFSISTVSLVLNEAPLSRYVAASTKEHIRAVASKLGYRPDAAARSLRSRRSHTIGIMVSDISDPFCTLILQGIEKALHPTTYLPIIMIAHNQRKQFGRHLEMMMERRVEGLILVANWLFGEFDQLADFRKSQIPMVGVGRDLTASRVRSLQVDNEAGGYAAARHLYDLGHRKIAVLRGPSELADSDRRWNGIQRFASEVGLPLASKRVGQLPAADDPTSGFEGGYRLISAMIEQGVEFTAVIAFDDLTGLGAIRALRQTGRYVPEDCSVIGFDDVPHAAVNTPGLTTIRQPMEEMGSLAAKWVLDSLADTKPSHTATETSSLSGTLHLLPPELVIRQSTTRRLIDIRTAPVTRLGVAAQGRSRRKKE